MEGYEPWMAHPMAVYYMGMSNRTGLFEDGLFEAGVIGLPAAE